jgi:DNA repair protein RadC
MLRLSAGPAGASLATRTPPPPPYRPCALPPEAELPSEAPDAGLDRPRERLASLGAEVLSDGELVALVLRTGGRRSPAEALGARLVAAHAGLRGLAGASLPQLGAERGIGPAKAASLHAAFELGRRLAARRLRPGQALSSPAEVASAFHPRLRDAAHERFVAVLLDGRHRVLRDVLVSQGTLTASLVHPREVFRPALREAAAALILVHNHPSGDPSPSREDAEITRRLARAGRLLGIDVLDHVIVAEQGFASLRERGLFEP